MSESKLFIKPTLNGAYYSSLPTSTTTTPITATPSPRRYKLFISIIVCFLFLAAVHHHHRRFNHHNHPKFHHVKASLTQFNLDTASKILYYNLTLAATLHHQHQHEPQPHPGTLYASASYYGHRFSADTQPRFNQETSTLELAFQGQNIVVLDDSEVERYNSEKELGKIRIGVKAHFERTFDLAGLKTMTFGATAECDLMVPLSSDGITASASVEVIDCEIH